VKLIRSQLIKLCSRKRGENVQFVESVKKEWTRRRNHRKRNEPLNIMQQVARAVRNASQLSPNLREDPPSVVSLADIDRNLI
jgi:RNase adaptor protein for sRNA GlmZ degradation